MYGYQILLIDPNLFNAALAWLGGYITKAEFMAISGYCEPHADEFKRTVERWGEEARRRLAVAIEETMGDRI